MASAPHMGLMKESDSAKAYPRTDQLSGTCPHRLPIAAHLQLRRTSCRHGGRASSHSLHAQLLPRHPIWALSRTVTPPGPPPDQISFLEPARTVSPSPHTSSYVEPGADGRREQDLTRCMHSYGLGTSYGPYEGK